MIVITLTKVPNALRGDLTKWCQEIQTGVYVGNVSARIRDALWQRIMENIGAGEATLVYNAKNELGYQFKTTRKDREVIDFDGIPLMMHLDAKPAVTRFGFSKAAKMHKAKVMTQAQVYGSAKKPAKPFVAIDIETTGLKVDNNEIISIGAYKRVAEAKYESFYKLIHIEQDIPDSIQTLTGLTRKKLDQDGISLTLALQEFQNFIGQTVIVGYNLKFDQLFLSYNLQKVGLPILSNRMIDLMPIVKKKNQFLDNYRLETVLRDYGLENKQPHCAVSDAEATFFLMDKLTKKGDFQV